MAKHLMLAVAATLLVTCDAGMWRQNNNSTSRELNTIQARSKCHHNIIVVAH